MTAPLVPSFGHTIHRAIKMKKGNRTSKKVELGPVHPGIILQEEFIEPLGLSQNKVAIAMRVPARRINEIVLGRRAITADTALRLSQYFGTSAELWMGLQMQYDLDTARQKLAGMLETQIQPRKSVAA